MQWIVKMDHQPIGHFDNREDANKYLKRIATEFGYELDAPFIRDTYFTYSDERFKIELDEYKPFVTLIKGQLTKSTEGSAGWDIHSNVDIEIAPGKQMIVTTDIITAMSRDRCCLIVDRSGMAAKMRLTKRAGLIDSDYLKCWGIVLCNEDFITHYIKVGDRVAQALFLPVIDDSEFHGGGFNRIYNQRNGGFGSTDVS